MKIVKIKKNQFAVFGDFHLVFEEGSILTEKKTLVALQDDFIIRKNKVPSDNWIKIWKEKLKWMTAGDSIGERK